MQEILLLTKKMTKVKLKVQGLSLPMKWLKEERNRMKLMECYIAIFN